MALTNAERQRRYIERLKTRAATHSTCQLTPEQAADRAVVMSEPLFPVPQGDARDQIPTFMGWNRYDWASAPDALVEHFGMTEAVVGWRAEREALEAQGRDAHAWLEAECLKIVERLGKPALDIMHRSGMFGLLSAYRKDPTLGVKPRGRRRVTVTELSSPTVTSRA